MELLLSQWKWISVLIRSISIKNAYNMFFLIYSSIDEQAEIKMNWFKLG